MVIVTDSWLWYVDSALPGFDAASDENLDAGENGLSIDPGGYTNITWNDANTDGKLGDSDADDGFGSDGDTVTIGAEAKIIKELALFRDSTVTIDGVTYTVDIPVWMFEDGTYATRLNDADIPAGTSPWQVTEVTLGTFVNGDTTDGTSSGNEYTHSFVSTRDEFFVCFAKSTLIETDKGQVPVESLQCGDLVVTLDNELQKIRWIGHRTIAAENAMAPIVFAKNAIGNRRDLRVSPQHRILMTGWRAELLFGTEEILVAAKHLVNGDTIYREPTPKITYFHLLFDQHEIIFAEGCAAESFHPGETALSNVDQATKREILTLFPELMCGPSNYGKTARLCLTASEASVFTAT